jgi:hypothetical protein
MSEPAVEPLVDPAAEPVAPAEPEIEYAQVPVDQWEQTQQTLAFLAQQEQQRLAQQQGAPEIPDQYEDPQGYAEWLGRFIDERNAPIRQQYDTLAQQEDEARLMDIVADEQAQNGEFLLQGGEGPDAPPISSPELARVWASRYVPEATQRFGNNDVKVAEYAIQKAAADVRAFEAALGRAWMEREQNHLRGLAGAPRAAPVGQAATQARGFMGSEMDVVRQYTGGFATGR